MVAQALQPGIASAKPARYNGIDDNLPFNWRQLSRQGMLILGSGGEFCPMSHETRLAAAEFRVNYVDGRVPVLLGIAAPGTAETIE